MAGHPHATSYFWVLFVFMSLATHNLIVAKAFRQIELYGCILRSDATQKDMVEFQMCVTEANGLKASSGGRWGRSVPSKRQDRVYNLALDLLDSDAGVSRYIPQS